MAMTDNSASLRTARRRDSQTKRARAAATLRAMLETGEPISFPAVARQAGVSVSLLYADHELATRLAEARDRQHQAGNERSWRLPTRALVTEQSLRSELANAKEQSRRLVEEVTILRDRLACQLGAGADFARAAIANPLLEQLEKRAEELEAENAQLRHRVTQLEGESHELNETLDAARAMNRELMSRLNSSASRSAGTRRSPSPRPHP